MSNNANDGLRGLEMVADAISDALDHNDTKSLTSAFTRIAVALEQIADIYTEQHALPVELFDAVQRGEHDDN
tara:strand:- start:378 stop:593 length:216 start_codon:yes stop_codon:yes gene_type:complete